MDHSDLDTDNREHRYFFEIWLAAVPMVTITVTTIAANGAILFMFLSRRGLRRCKNVYIASLALADFLVGLCMPLKLTKDLHRSWGDGWSCRLFQTFRQSLMYASFLSIFLITFDKWRAIHYPVSYRNRRTKRLAIAAVVIVWIISFFVFSVPQIWFDDFVLSRSSAQTSTGDNSLDTVPDSDSSNKQVNPDPQPDASLISLQTPSNYNHPSLNRKVYRFGVCSEVYYLGFHLGIVSTTILYVIPLLVMLIFDISLYLKIKWRKSVEVQRSTSVTDTYFMTLKKPVVDLDETSNSNEDDAAKESLLKSSDGKPVNKHLINKHLALGGARGERRHSSLPAISPIIKGRTSSGRRVSMPEGGNSERGGCRYVGRKWSGCSAALQNQNQPPNPMANLAPRVHNEDVVHDLLVKQDRKAARCLCLMLLTLVLCWLPHAVVSIVNAKCWCLHGGAITATTWLFMLDHGVNPFLYGMMNAQFKNVVKQWLLIERVHAFKMRDTLILKNLQKKVAAEESNRDKSPLPETKDHCMEFANTENNADFMLTNADHTQL